MTKPKRESAVEVRVQKWERIHARPRWAYVIDQPGEPLYVSPYRYQSGLAAQKAGEREAGL